MEKGKCCEYCTKHEQPECPVKSAEPWSRWRNFCSEFEGNEKAAMCDSEHIAPVVRSNATGWISVEDRLPNVKQKVIILNTYGEITDFYKAILINRKAKHKIWMNPDTGYIYGGVTTHWMVPEV